MNNKSLGRWGEEEAAAFLTNKGYAVLERNFKNKIGEIDLVARDGKMIIFVEVKARKSLACGQPYESVHPQKQRKLVLVALSYLKWSYGSVDIMARFDVISIYQDPAGVNHIEHLVNAFESSY